MRCEIIYCKLFHSAKIDFSKQPLDLRLIFYHNVKVMDLPNLFSSSPKKDKLFLGIVFTEQSVQAILWKIAKGDISVIKSSAVLNFDKEENIIVKTDQALQELGELSENLSEVIFGLESSWVSQKGILDHKKILLKKLIADLSLKPIGFVVITEAVIQTLTKNEPHFSGLLLFYTQTKISVSLIESGIIQKTESVGRSKDSIGDLVEALARFPHSKDKKLPTKIKLISVNLSKEELYDQYQNLLGYDWVAKGHFSSVPTIESLPEDTLVSSVIKQGGKVVAKTQGLEINELKISTTQANQQKFGFGEVKIVNGVEQSASTADDNQTAVSTFPTTAPTQFSFGIPISSHQLPKIDDAKSDLDMARNIPLKTKPKVKPFKSHQPGPAWGWLKSHRTFALIGFIAGLLTLLIIGFISLIFSSTAILTLDLNPQSINKDVTIILDPKIAQSDFSKLILKSELTKKTVTANQVNETTGTTLVGEKAQGKIEIWNKTDGEKSFPAGTNFTTGSLRFTLNEDVTIASSSTKENTSTGEKTTTPGKTEARLTAVKIGAESNLEKDAKLTVDSFSVNSYEATVLESFSGGSSREIRVVSKEDETQLFAEVKKKALEMANLEYQADSTGEKTFVSTNILDVTETKYSAKVGDETKTLSLDLTATVEAIVYQKADLKPLAETVLADLIPSGFEIVAQDPQILSEINNKNASGSAITIDANLATQAIPIVDLDALKKEVASQSISSTTAILKGKKEIKNFTLELFPKILEKIWKKLPVNPNRIEIKTS